MKRASPKTKIIATLGPASFDRRVIRQLLRAGVSGFRLNLSHGSLATHAEALAALRQLAAEAGRTAAVIIDLPGPKMRLGTLPAPLAVRRGDTIRFCPADELPEGGDHCLPHEIEGLHQAVQPGEIIYVGDGMLQFRVVRIDGQVIETEALRAGEVRSHKGINLPGFLPPTGALTERDRAGIAFAVEQRADIICVSFVGSGEDLTAVRTLLPAGPDRPWLLAKIERRQAVENLDDILAEADAVMVARGDLGIELPIEEIPIRQKEIIRRANIQAKPVVVATQMLLSMVDNPRPTRAEVTDVANAILDGADAVMFSEETAIGRDPAAVVRTAGKIAGLTERELVKPGSAVEQVRGRIHRSDSIEDMVCSAAHEVLSNRTVDLAVTPTTTGATARRIARLRPRQWILAVTERPLVANVLSLSFGVVPLLTSVQPVGDEPLLALLMESRLVRSGQRLLITAGTSSGVPGSTNSLKILDLC